MFADVSLLSRVYIPFALSSESPSPIMHVITMNYNPLDCTGWAYSPLEYCEYCNLVCDAALEDFECRLGDWFFLGQDGQSFALFMRPY
jgi:hypothetical protein